MFKTEDSFVPGICELQERPDLGPVMTVAEMISPDHPSWTHDFHLGPGAAHANFTTILLCCRFSQPFAQSRDHFLD